MDALMERAGSGGPIVAGAAFAVAWTPCIGPTLAAILSAAALSGSEGHGALLLAFYSAGLAIPFLAHRGRLHPDDDRVRGGQAPLRAIMAMGGVILIAHGRPDLDGRAVPPQLRGAAVPR